MRYCGNKMISETLAAVEKKIWIFRFFSTAAKKNNWKPLSAVGKKLKILELQLRIFSMQLRFDQLTLILTQKSNEFIDSFLNAMIRKYSHNLADRKCKFHYECEKWHIEHIFPVLQIEILHEWKKLKITCIYIYTFFSLFYA